MMVKALCSSIYSIDSIQNLKRAYSAPVTMNKGSEHWLLYSKEIFLYTCKSVNESDLRRWRSGNVVSNASCLRREGKAKKCLK